MAEKFFLKFELFLLRVNKSEQYAPKYSDWRTSESREAVNVMTVYIANKKGKKSLWSNFMPR